VAFEKSLIPISMEPGERWEFFHRGPGLSITWNLPSRRLERTPGASHKLSDGDRAKS